MQPGQTEKLKILIQTSAILSPSERAEWLALLDVMNDKQVFELEKILTVGQQSSVKAAVPDFRTSGVNLPPPSLRQVPHLSHILNLPQHLNPSGDALAAPPTAEPPKVDNKPKSRFGEKLKSIFAEKELPPGHGDILDLPAPPTKIATPGSALPSRDTGGVAVEKPSLPPVVPKPKTPAAALNNISEPPVKLNHPDVLNTTLPPAVPLVFSKHADNSKVNPAAAAILQKTPVKPVLPGLEPPSAIPPGQKNNLPPKAPAQKPAPAQPAPPDVSAQKKQTTPQPAVHLPDAKLELDKLSDTALLDVKNLRILDPEFLVKQIKALIGQNGYHEVIFNLEKSPLYLNYIKTGAEILNGRADFEALSQKPEAESYLNRQEFERMTDLLRAIQAE